MSIFFKRRGSDLCMIFTLLIYLFSNSITVKAQNTNDKAQIKIYGFEEGLSHRNTFKVTQDSLGYIWAGTINGLNRFDTETFLKYNSGDAKLGFPGDYVSDMMFINDSTIILSFPGQLIRYSIIANTSSLVLDLNNPGQSSSIVYQSLYVDRNGTLWCFAYNNKNGTSILKKINRDGELVDVKKCVGIFLKRSICEFGEHIFYTHDNNIIKEIDKNGTHLKDHVLLDFIGLQPRVWVTKIYSNSKKELWALTDNGHLYKLNKNQNRFKKIVISDLENTPDYNFLHVDSEGSNIWIGGNGKLCSYNINENTLIDFNSQIQDLIKYKINYRDVFIDKTGIIWIASDFGLIKLVLLNPLFKTFLSESNEHCHETNCSIRGITGNGNGTIYFSYYNSIHALNTRTGALNPIFSNQHFFNPPFGLVHHNGKLWTGNGRRIDLKRNRIDTILQMPATDLGDVMVDDRKLVWFAYHNTIAYYDEATDRLTYYKDKTSQLDAFNLESSYIFQGSNQETFWLGTLDHGIFHLHKADGFLAHYHSRGVGPFFIPNNKINGIYEDNESNIWFASGKGLGKISTKENKIAVYGKGSGISNEFINGILSEGDTVIWVSTDLGISRFSINEESFINFTKDDGLSGNEFNRISFYKDHQNVMYFGGLHGVNSFIPGKHLLKQKKDIEGSILLSSFSKLDGQTDSLVNLKFGFRNQDKISLHWKDKFFTFQFALANYANPSAHTYSYKLDGFDKEWSKASSYNIARYNNVPHGDYVFRVRAKSGNRDWNEEELSIAVKVNKAFFKTWWFIGLSIIGIIATFLAISQYRLNQANKRELELRQKVRDRTNELEIEVKKSDDLLLNILPANIAEELKTNGAVKAKRHESVTVFLSDFIGFTKVSQQLEPEELVHEIDFYFSEFDSIVEKHCLEKIKTIGDAYMCVGGISNRKEESAKNVVLAALEIQEFIRKTTKERLKSNIPHFETRIGIHTGPVVSGVVGIKKFAYDIWGDTVNIAARLEDKGEKGKVNISRTTYELIKNEFEFEKRGKVKIKHNEEMDMFFVEKQRINL